MRRAAALCQVGGRGAGKDPGLKEPPCDERRGLRLAETHSGVKAVGHEVAETVASHDLHRQLRVGGQEFPEARCEHETREEGIAVATVALFQLTQDKFTNGVLAPTRFLPIGRIFGVGSVSLIIRISVRPIEDAH